VIVGKMRGLLEPHDAQGRCDGASSGDEKRSHHQTSTCRQVGAVNAVLKGPIHAANAFALPSPASGIHPIPRIDVSGTASKTLGPVRIHYNITLDSITQDSTMFQHREDSDPWKVSRDATPCR
jgi:hypothetical protein